MRILLASTGYDISSGATRCLIELAVQLKRRGLQVLVVIPKHGNIENYLKEESIPYFYVHEYHSWYTSEKHIKNKFFIKRLLNIKSLVQMIMLIKWKKIDVVHVNALTAYIAGWAGSICRVPVVWHIREFMEEDLNITFYNRDYAIKKLNKATQMVAISKAIKDKWKKELSVPISVIYDGIPIQNYYVIRENIPIEKIKIIIYGRIVPPKGQLFFFQGIKNIISDIDKKIECYWAGQIEDLTYFHEIQNFIEYNQLTDIVTYLGEVSNIKSVLENMDVVCVCSRQEGFGRVTVEAMLSGCCVLGADTGATKEIINDNSKGYLYEYGNIESFSEKLKLIIENIEDVKQIAENAQEYAMKTFSIENNVNKILEIYQKVLCVKKND